MANPPAMHSPLPLRTRLTLMMPVSLVVLLVDQLSKAWAVSHLAGHPPRTYLGILTLTYAENLGAWGSLGAGWTPTLRFAALTAFPMLLLVGVGIHILRDRLATRTDLVALALVIGGGAGNLIDRLQLGHVRDFLYLGYGPIGTNIFNIADSMVMLALPLLLFGRRPEPNGD